MSHRLRSDLFQVFVQICFKISWSFKHGDLFLASRMQTCLFKGCQEETPLAALHQLLQAE